MNKDLFSFIGAIFISLKNPSNIDILEGSSFKHKAILYSLIFFAWIVGLFFGFFYMITSSDNVKVTDIYIILTAVFFLVGNFLLHSISRLSSDKIKELVDGDLSKFLIKIKSVSKSDFKIVKWYLNEILFIEILSYIAVGLAIIYSLTSKSFETGLYFISLASVSYAFLVSFILYHLFSSRYKSSIIYLGSSKGIKLDDTMLIEISKVFGLVYSMNENEYYVFDKNVCKWIYCKIKYDMHFEEVKEIIEKYNVTN